MKLESDTQESSLRSPSFEAKRTKDGALPSVRSLPRFSTTSFVLRGQQKIIAKVINTETRFSTFKSATSAFLLLTLFVQNCTQLRLLVLARNSYAGKPRTLFLDVIFFFSIGEQWPLGSFDLLHVYCRDSPCYRRRYAFLHQVNFNCRN